MCGKQDNYRVTDNLIHSQRVLQIEKKVIREENHYFTLWLRYEQNCSIFYKEDDESQTLGRSPKYWVALQKKYYFFLY
jgi:hypothetical protein